MGSGGGGGGSSGAGQRSRGFLSSRGSISFDRRTNTLLVIATPDRVANIKNLAMQLDRPVDQVVIEAWIVIATESFAREMGAKFGINGATGKDGDRCSMGSGSTTAVLGNNPEEHGTPNATGK